MAPMHEALGEPRPFTADEVLQMVEAGILDASDHVELLEGALCTMSPQGPEHASLTVRVRRRLEAAFGDAAHGRDHTSMWLDRHSLPEPDVAVVRGPEGDYFTRLPDGRDVLLLVEISKTSQARDRYKAGLYSRAGVAVYWIIDIDARTLTVYRAPTAEGYSDVETLTEDDAVSVPETSARIPVRELLT